MVLTITGQIVACLIFGLVAAGGRLLIKGPRKPFPFWVWIGDTWWAGFFAWIILYGLIKL